MRNLSGIELDGVSIRAGVFQIENIDITENSYKKLNCKINYDPLNLEEEY